MKGGVVVPLFPAAENAHVANVVRRQKGACQGKQNALQSRALIGLMNEV
jgi:hypothetical protein